VEREEWDERYGGDELLWRAEPNRFLPAATADLAPGTVLDVACGEGRNAIWLAEQGWKATGVDFSGVALAKGRRMAAERGVEVEWIEADLRTWRPERGVVYDLVIVFYLQLPAAARRSVHRHVAGAVAPGGRLLVVAHDLDNLTAGVGGPQDPAVLFQPSDVLDDIAGLDPPFTVERAEKVQRPVETDAGTVDAIDVLVRVRRQAG
jgi:SAM-dependent methyltransferase